jgi:NTP pyrophosphatase (non-canonical NTP hydrolase)
MKDLQLKHKDDLFEMIERESARQIRKWGIQDRHPFEWLAYATEELGELSEAISEFIYRDGLQSNIVREAIQTATLLIKMAEMFTAYDPYTIRNKDYEPQR